VVLSALVAAALAAAAVAILMRRALRPLGELADAAGAIERTGDPRRRLPQPSGRRANNTRNVRRASIAPSTGPSIGPNVRRASVVRSAGQNIGRSSAPSATNPVMSSVNRSAASAGPKAATKAHRSVLASFPVAWAKRLA